MHPRRAVPTELERLAHFQNGVVTTEQALAHGLTPAVLARLRREGRWVALHKSVYLTGPGEPSWAALAWAGVLLGGDHARLGPAASAHLWGLGPESDPVDVLVPLGTTRRARGPWVFARERPGARSPRTVGSPPRLTAADTVLDLTNSLDEAAVVDLAIRATAQRLVSSARLGEALAARAVHRHRALLRDLLLDVAEGIESGLELHYLREVERAHGLPAGQRQRYRGGLRHRTDVGYDPYGLLVELDGRLGHEGAGRFRDFRRDNAFALRAYLTLRFGWLDVVDRPCQVAAQVAAVLVAHGWEGCATRCDRCRNASEEDLC